MMITIEIPKEFEEQYNNDNFAESLTRIDSDIRFQGFLSGLLEVELIEMLKDAFKGSKQNENEQLKQQIEQLQKINKEQKETLKKVRVALIQERTANIMNYGKGGVEMFDNMFEILKGVSN